MIPAPRRLALLEAGKLKLAAKARLAEGGQSARYDAAVLYHAAARAEQRALLALEAPSPEARLASAIERCACLILGFDASEVLDLGWADVLEASSAVEKKTAEAMRARIDEMMRDFVERYQKALGKVPAHDARVEAGAPPRPATRSARRDLDRFLQAFPGDAFAWARRSALSFEEGDAARAWEEIRRARELVPQEDSFMGWELRLVSKHLPTAQAEARLAEAYARIERDDASANVCFGFVIAALDLAPKSKHRDELLRQASNAATREAARAPQSEDRKMFRALDLSLREMLAGRKPGLEILYRCGLGHLAAAAPKQADPMKIVLARTTPFRRLAA